MPIKVHVHVADACPGEPIPETVITIDGAVPDFMNLPDVLARYAHLYDIEAEAIEQALIKALPGGTYDRLLGRMLARKATHFRVAHRE